MFGIGARGKLIYYNRRATMMKVIDCKFMSYADNYKLACKNNTPIKCVEANPLTLDNCMMQLLNTPALNSWIYIDELSFKELEKYFVSNNLEKYGYILRHESSWLSQNLHYTVAYVREGKYHTEEPFGVGLGLSFSKGTLLCKHNRQLFLDKEIW